MPSLGGVLMDVHGTPFFQLFHISKYFQTIQKKTRQKVCRSLCPPAAHMQDALQVGGWWAERPADFLPTSRPHAGCFASCFPAASLLFLLLPPTFSSRSPPLPPPPATPLGFQLQKPKLSRMQSKMRLTTAEAWESKYFESLTSSVVDR